MSINIWHDALRMPPENKKAVVCFDIETSEPSFVAEYCGVSHNFFPLGEIWAKKATHWTDIPERPVK